MHQVAHEKAREIASEVAREPAKPSAAAVIDRAGYTVRLPEGSTVDPEAADVDKDHMTAANLPDDSTLVFLMIDDPSVAPAAFARIATSLQNKLETVKADGEMSFDASRAARYIAFRGTMTGGDPVVFELAQWNGPQRAYVVIAQYPQRSAARAGAMLRQTLATLQLKV